MSPLHAGVEAVEHVMQWGEPLVRPAAADLHLHQLLLLDVLLALCLASLLPFAMVAACRRITARLKRLKLMTITNSLQPLNDTHEPHGRSHSMTTKKYQ